MNRTRVRFIAARHSGPASAAMADGRACPQSGSCASWCCILLRTDFEQLEFHLADSPTYRTFCLLGLGNSPPKRACLQKNLSALVPEHNERGFPFSLTTSWLHLGCLSGQGCQLWQAGMTYPTASDWWASEGKGCLCGRTEVVFPSPRNATETVAFISSHPKLGRRRTHQGPAADRSATYGIPEV